MNSQPHIIAIAIGPVQDFIAASRKTRDLWFGSTLLSRTARAAANKLQGEGATLIFPALVADDPADSDTPIPNKLLAILPAEKAPADVAQEVKTTARGVLEEDVEKVKKELGDTDLVSWSLVDAQVDRFLEFYAAWVRFDPDTKDGYTNGRDRVEHLLAGRKALRDFDRALDVWEHFDERPPDPRDRGAAKSSLDPSRETVFQLDGKPVSARNKLENEDHRRKLKIKGGEQLDGISLIKRHVEPRRFVSVSRVAIDPFIRRLNEEKPNELGTLRDLAGELRKSDAVEWFPTGPDSGLQHYQAFSYDCQLFYDSAERDAELTDAEKEKTREFYDAAHDARRALNIGELPVHLAVLAADGDHMGAAISKRTTDGQHKAFSERLANFAAKAGEIVTNHHGALIYSGGDDVLAFLPLDTALCCADELRREFDTIVNEDKPTDSPLVSLSAGIAVGHYSEHLQNLLDWARRAERAAKDSGRNALAVAMHTRTAGPTGTTVTHKWSDEPVTERWMRWIDWHRRYAIPDGAAYELRELAQKDLGAMDPAMVTNRRFGGQGDSARSLLELEVERILKRKEPRGTKEKKLKPDEIDKLLGCIDNSLDGLQRLVDELIIARHFAEVVTVALGDWQKGQDQCP